VMGCPCDRVMGERTTTSSVGEKIAPQTRVKPRMLTANLSQATSAHQTGDTANSFTGVQVSHCHQKHINGLVHDTEGHCHQRHIYGLVHDTEGH
jgi:hypothetical protein